MTGVACVSAADGEVLVEYHASDHAYVSSSVYYPATQDFLGTKPRLRTETILHSIRPQKSYKQ